MNPSGTATEPRRQALPQLTGIRAIAFLMVFLFHSQFKGWFLWSGVDLFFVLSGFLITGILLEQDKGAGYFRTFYLNRVLRIFPPFYLVLVLVVLAFDRVNAGHLAATASFTANLYLPFALKFTQPPSYWALSPYWSLALEEQFYLFWPLLVYWLTPRQLLWVCAAMIVAAPLARIDTLLSFQQANGVEAVYMFPLNRLDLLAGGALIALCRHLRLYSAEALARTGQWMAGASLALLLALAALRGDFRQGANSLIFSSLGYSLICALMCGLILYLVNASGGRVVRWLSTPPMVYLGTISYTLYLVHHAVISLLESRFGMVSGWAMSGAAFALSFAVAALSWHLLENPIKRFKNKHLRAPAGKPAAAA